MASTWTVLIDVIIDRVDQEYAVLTLAVVLLTTALRPLIVKARRRSYSPRSGTLRILLAVAVVLLATALPSLRTFVRKVRRRRHIPRSGTLRILSDPGGAKFDIVAIHGLGADPEHTWTHAAPTEPAGRSQEPTAADHGPAHHPRIHLLRDLLRLDFPDARILSFEHNSSWLTDAPVKTSEEIGKSLLREIRDKRSEPHLPIIFIGHSLGGIIIKHALCGQDAKETVDDTSGIIFLGTPHLGSSASVAGAILAFATRLLGSDTTLLLSLKSHDAQLSNLAARFRSVVVQNERRGQETRIISFYETKPTYLLGWLSLGRVVARDSAVVHADEEHDIDSDHSGLNKCAGRGDELYQKLKKAIDDLRVPSLLEQADKLICDKHYTESKLRIERLSGDQLPMDQCYINLAMVEKFGPDADRSDQRDANLSPFTLLSRQKAETPSNVSQVELATLFSPRTGRSGGTIKPRRILIRGRAGVGKTTLCKKIVHEFTRHTWSEWTKLFDRVLWVPLRNLKLPERAKIAGYNFEHLFNHEYFSLHNKPRLATVLLGALKADSSKTLFLLDGLDELSQDLTGHGSIPNFLAELLQQRNVIITSRPNANHPALQDLDLELETIGFSPKQVNAYLDADPNMMPRANEVKSFLQHHRLIQGLVRIPIQLDALCYAWEDLKRTTLPNTMTRIYQAIEQKLWKKDAVRLNKISEGDAQIARPAEIKLRVKTEIALLECFAFNGLHSDVIDFTPDHRDKLVEMSQLSDLPLDETLARLSFLRTSDPSTRLEDRNYHFLHLTFQEFFAARYFVKQWKEGKPLAYVFNQRNGAEANVPGSPTEFLQIYKYSPYYDVFWRFVAGLLEAEGENEILRFFNAIEDEPFDLLGPTHQRLVMHCLSEVAELPIRSSLEARLSQWLSFECDLTGTSLLATESELPVGALQCALQHTSGRERFQILAALSSSGRHYSEATVAALAPLLKDEDDNVRLRAAEVLEKQSKLPETALSALGALLEDEEWTVRIRAAEILEKQSNLPEATLSARGALLKDEDEDIRLRAPELLEKQSNLPEATLAAPEALAALEALTAPRMDMKVIARSRATETFLWRSKLLLAVLLAVAMLKSMEYTVPHLVPEFLIWQPKEALLELSALVALVALLRRMALAELEALAKLEALTAPRMEVIAAETLLRQSKLPLAALLALVAMLKSRMYTVLWSGVPDFVLEILESQSKLPEAALSALVALLKDEEEIVRFRGAEVLKKRSKLPEATLAMLETLLKDEDKDVRLRAIEILETQSRLSEATLSALGALLKDEDEDVRLRAVEVLQRQTKLPEATLATLETLLKDEDKNVRLLTTEILEKQSNLPEAMRSALRALLKDEDEDVRLRAAEVLKMQSKLPEATVSALGSLLKDEVEDVRLRAAEILEKQTKLPETALSALGALLEDEEWTVRIRAAEGSGKQSKLPDAATGTLATLLALLTLLKDEEWTVRLRAIGALGTPSKLLEASALGALLKGEDEEIRFCAAMDLPEATLSALVALVTDEEWNICLRAAEIFEVRSKLPGATLSALGAALLKDEERVVRLSAVGALGRQSRLPEATVSALVTLLKDEGERVRSRAAMALGKQSKLPEATVSALVALLKDEEWTVRSLADRALAGQSDLPEKFLKSIGSLLESENQGEITASAICIPEYARLLYQSLLRRSFREQCSLHIGNDSCSFNQPDGLRAVSFEHNRPDRILDAIRKHCQWWNAHSYTLWDRCDGEAVRQALSTM